MAALAEGTLEDEYETVTCNGTIPTLTIISRVVPAIMAPFNVMDAIKQSCNIFFYDVGRRLGIEAIDRYAPCSGSVSRWDWS